MPAFITMDKEKIKAFKGEKKVSIKDISIRNRVKNSEVFRKDHFDGGDGDPFSDMYYRYLRADLIPGIGVGGAFDVVLLAYSLICIENGEIGEMSAFEGKERVHMAHDPRLPLIDKGSSFVHNSNLSNLYRIIYAHNRNGIGKLFANCTQTEFSETNMIDLIGKTAREYIDIEESRNGITKIKKQLSYAEVYILRQFLDMCFVREYSFISSLIYIFVTLFNCINRFVFLHYYLPRCILSL